MVLAAGYAPVSQPLPAAVHAARLSLNAIIPLYHTIQIPAGLPHPAHKKQAHRSGPVFYLCDREYRDKRRYSRSFT